MFLAKITGNITATQKVPIMTGQKLFIVDPLRVDEKSGHELKPTGRTFVAVDSVGAGEGEVVLVVGGSSAGTPKIRRTFPSTWQSSASSTACGSVANRSTRPMRDPAINIDHPLRVLRIIATALIFGVVCLTVVAVMLARGNGQPAQPRGQLISLIMAGLAVTEVVPFALVPNLVPTSSPLFHQESAGADRELPSGAPHGLVGVYQVRTIIRYALLEGAALANLIAYFIERNWWSLAIVGGLVFIMLAIFPTRTRLEHWLELERLTTP